MGPLWAKIFEYGIATAVIVWFMWVVYPRLRGLENSILILARLIDLLILKLSVDKDEAIHEQAERMRKMLDEKEKKKGFSEE